MNILKLLEGIECERKNVRPHSPKVLPRVPKSGKGDNSYLRYSGVLVCWCIGVICVNLRQLKMTVLLNIKREERRGQRPGSDIFSQAASSELPLFTPLINMSQGLLTATMSPNH